MRILTTQDNSEAHASRMARQRGVGYEWSFRKDQSHYARVKPLLYRTIVVSVCYSIEGHPKFINQILSTALRSKLPAFFRNSVRHLLLHGFE